MKKYILVKEKSNVLKNYSIKFNEGNIKTIETNIDSYYGLGELKEEIRTNFDLFYDPSLSTQKIKIVSKEFLKTEEEWLNDDVILHDVNLYKYKYYAYEPHPLSLICSNIKEINDRLELSATIKDLFDYTCCNQKDKDFFQSIISEIEFNELDDYYDENKQDMKILELKLPTREKIKQHMMMK